MRERRYVHIGSNGSSDLVFSRVDVYGKRLKQRQQWKQGREERILLVLYSLKTLVMRLIE